MTVVDFDDRSITAVTVFHFIAHVHDHVSLICDHSDSYDSRYLPQSTVHPTAGAKQTETIARIRVIVKFIDRIFCDGHSSFRIKLLPPRYATLTNLMNALGPGNLFRSLFANKRQHLFAHTHLARPRVNYMLP